MLAYKKLLKLYGTNAEIARIFKISPQAITYWKKHGVPLGQAVRVEKITKGAVTAADVLKG